MIAEYDAPFSTSDNTYHHHVPTLCIAIPYPRNVRKQATSDLQSNEIISNDDIKKISFAAGGSQNEYDFITYVAKDKRDNRYVETTIMPRLLLALDVRRTVSWKEGLTASSKPGALLLLLLLLTRTTRHHTTPLPRQQVLPRF